MDKWQKFLIAERKRKKKKAPSRKSGAGLEKSLNWFLDKGPQKKGGYQNKRQHFGRKKFNDISAPPGAPGGLEEEVDIDSFKKHDTLSRRFWNSDNTLKDPIVKRCIAIVIDFLEGLDIGAVIEAEDIRLTGSLANYNWSKYSDVDLHVVVDFAKIDPDQALVKAFFDASRMRWNERHMIEIYGHEVEIYVENINEDHKSSGIYSLMEGEWIIKPNAEKVEIDFAAAHKKSDNIETQINLIGRYAKEKPKMALRSIERLKEKIRRMRKAGLNSPMQEYSSENIAFKMLRREEALQKLNILRYDAYDTLMSMGNT